MTKIENILKFKAKIPVYLFLYWTVTPHNVWAIATAIDDTFEVKIKVINNHICSTKYDRIGLIKNLNTNIIGFELTEEEALKHYIMETI